MAQYSYIAGRMAGRGRHDVELLGHLFADHHQRLSIGAQALVFW